MTAADPSLVRAHETIRDFCGTFLSGGDKAEALRRFDGRLARSPSPTEDVLNVVLQYTQVLTALASGQAAMMSRLGSSTTGAAVIEEALKKAALVESLDPLERAHLIELIEKRGR